MADTPACNVASPLTFISFFIECPFARQKYRSKA
jgi:hypothetical protein